MKKFLLQGGGHVQAATDLELVEALRLDGMAWLPTVAVEDFMEGMAVRAKVLDGSVIRTDSVQKFLYDLQMAHFLEPEEDPWMWVALDTIRLGLTQFSSPGMWNHRLLWSFDQPIVISYKQNGQGNLVSKKIDLAQLSDAYQRLWVKTHVHDIRKYGLGGPPQVTLDGLY